MYHGTCFGAHAKTQNAATNATDVRVLKNSQRNGRTLPTKQHEHHESAFTRPPSFPLLAPPNKVGVGDGSSCEAGGAPCEPDEVVDTGHFEDSILSHIALVRKADYLALDTE
jgi:hypothetical protein